MHAQAGLQRERHPTGDSASIGSDLVDRSQMARERAEKSQGQSQSQSQSRAQTLELAQAAQREAL